MTSNPKLSVTPKLHFLFEHVADYCEKVNRGLGITAEQAHESLHSFFDREHEKNKVKLTSTPNHAKGVLRSVLEANAMSCIPVSKM